MHESDNKYFFWGSAIDEQYALYNNVIDRFLIVSHSADILEHVAFLLSSKISLFLVPISQAPNFSTNLIDNSCCLRWSAENLLYQSSRKNVGLPVRRSNYYLTDCDLLVEKSEVSDVKELQKIAWICHHFVDLFRSDTNELYKKFYDLVSWPIENPDIEKIKQAQRRIFDVIFLETNYDKIKDEIEKIFDDKTKETLLRLFNHVEKK